MPCCKSVVNYINGSFNFFVQVKDLVKKAETTFGPVDILVNNAGVFAFTLMKNVKEDAWDKCIEVNCKVSLYFQSVSNSRRHGVKIRVSSHITLRPHIVLKLSLFSIIIIITRYLYSAFPKSKTPAIYCIRCHHFASFRRATRPSRAQLIYT